LRAIRRIIRVVDLYSHRLALECGVTIPQLSCLIRLSQDGPMPLKQLAREADLSSSTLVGVIDRLEKKGLARRVRSTVDRRQVWIYATDEGKELAEQSPSPMHLRVTQALKALPKKQQATIAASIEKIVEWMEADAAEGLETLEAVTAELPAQGKSGRSAGETELTAAPPAPAGGPES